MTLEKQIPRKRTLTDEDLEELRVLLADHPCKYPFTQEQANTLVGVANNIQTAQSISFKVVVTAIILTVVGWVSKGFIIWLVNAAKTGGLGK